MSYALWAAILVAIAAVDHPAAALVDEWQAALKGGRRDAVLSLMTADVIIYESGEAENSRDEYAEHHLDADMSFAAATTTTIEDRRVVDMGETALVLSRTATAGSFEGNPVSSKGAETLVLRKMDGAWRIAHIHWSSRRIPPRKPQSASAPLTDASGREHLSAGRLASQLQAAGLKVERKGSVRQPFFAVPAKVLAIGVDEIEVFEFASVQDAEKAAATVSLDGGTIGTAAVHWIAPPHFHRRDRTLLIHLGGTPAVRSALDLVAGPAFAGRNRDRGPG